MRPRRCPVLSTTPLSPATAASILRPVAPRAPARGLPPHLPLARHTSLLHCSRSLGPRLSLWDVWGKVWIVGATTHFHAVVEVRGFFVAARSRTSSLLRWPSTRQFPANWDFCCPPIPTALVPSSTMASTPLPSLGCLRPTRCVWFRRGMGLVCLFLDAFLLYHLRCPLHSPAHLTSALSKTQPPGPGSDSLPAGLGGLRMWVVPGPPRRCRLNL